MAATESVQKVASDNVFLRNMSADEYETYKMRQAEGIRRAKALGIRCGRPKVEVPPNFGQIVEEWQNKCIPLDVALRLCGMSSSTFFRRVKEYRKRAGI